MDNNWNAWNNRANNRWQASQNFYNNRYNYWNNLQSWNNWGNWNWDNWGDYRNELWDYRAERAEEIWDNARDWYDDVFDDHWWGGWYDDWPGHYPANPWWWWRGAAWNTVSHFVNAITPDPIYIDYGANVLFQEGGDTVYVDRQPMPVAQYVEPMIELAVNIEQPLPPMPPPAEAPASKATAANAAAEPVEEWLPLGVFALAQEKEGQPILLFQISVNREGIISGAYSSTITDDVRQIAGQVDKASQRVAWRIGENTEVIFVTSLANLTQDVSPVEIHWTSQGRQTWLLVRMHEPAPAGQPAAIPAIDKKPPPLRKFAGPAK